MGAQRALCWEVKSHPFSNTSSSTNTEDAKLGILNNVPLVWHAVLVCFCRICATSVDRTVHYNLCLTIMIKANSDNYSKLHKKHAMSQDINRCAVIHDHEPEIRMMKSCFFLP